MAPLNVHGRYAAAYGNLSEIAPPQILADPTLIAMMEGAIERGQALTEGEVKQVFPGDDWEECKA
jgi:hypothetical protein